MNTQASKTECHYPQGSLNSEHSYIKISNGIVCDMAICMNKDALNILHNLCEYKWLMNILKNDNNLLWTLRLKRKSVSM